MIAKIAANLKCPSCGKNDSLAEVNTLRGYAMIDGLDDKGNLEFSGYTDIDWNSQCIAYPHKFVCLNCGAEFTFKEMIEASQTV